MNPAVSRPPQRPATPGWWLAGLGLAAAALLAGCAGNPERAELERLRQENEALRSRVAQVEAENRQLRKQPATPSEVYAHFANDAAQGSLGGLQPGIHLAQARSRYGVENRARSWTSEGRVIFQYEWDLAGGLVLRVNTDRQQRVERIAVVLDGTQTVSLPTLADLTLGQETYASLQKRFPGLSTSLQLWGAQGLYTVAQTLPLGEDRRLEFAYQLPASLGRVELDRIEREVQRQRNSAVLEPHLRDRGPFLVALEQVR